MNIREFIEESNTDYESGVAIWNANWPDYLETVEQWKAWHATRNPEHFYQRLLGEIDGHAACYAHWGEAVWGNLPGKHEWDLYVHPDHDFETVATQMYDFIAAKIMQRKPSKLSTTTRSDKSEQIAFLESRGYKLAQTEPTSLLDVMAFDPSTFQSTVDRVANAGIKMYSWAEAKEMDPQWKQKFFDLVWEISQDVPSTDPPKKPPFEVYSKKLDDPIATPLHTRNVAIDTTTATQNDSGTYVAVSNFDYNKVNTTRGHTGLTGVARAYRRKGIATAIKVHAISRAKADGLEIIDTDNDENNPMLELNVRLGFKPGPAWLVYELAVE